MIAPMWETLIERHGPHGLGACPIQVGHTPQAGETLATSHIRGFFHAANHPRRPKENTP